MLVEVAVPEMAVSVLTYKTETAICSGARVIVEIQKHLHTGFVIGSAKNELPPDVEAKPIAGIIDDSLMTDSDIWDLAVWAGKVCMCGVNTALRVILPKNFYTGEKVEPPPKFQRHNQFTELHNFNPFDSERVNFYLSELEKPERTLMLFPTREAAKDFYTNILPENLQYEAVLWPYTKNWDVWQLVNAKRFRIVIGAPGAVFAPLMPEKIIVEDEANANYILPYGLKISARSLAGRRASFLGSKLILGGRMPSLKTYMRTHAHTDIKPERKDIVIADMYTSRKEELHGIDGSIPLTFSLIRRTYTELVKGHNVMWILNRQGESQEVYCEKCGHVLRCDRCGNIMRSFNDGDMLKCRVCGKLRELPQKCEKCGSEFFKGKRPGIEALARIIAPYYPKIKLYVKGSRKSSMKGLILTTNRGLEILGEVKPALVAWLDIDAELFGSEYDSRYRVFSRLYDSYFAGRDRGEQRKILIQCRRSGRKLAEFLIQRYEKFGNDELKERRDFMIPPCAYTVELDSRGKIPREEIISILEDHGLFVMDPGDENLPLSVSVESLDEILGVIEPYSGMLNITVRSE
ncbi:MAG: hypothetical protein IJP54_08225 [Synergistaceae bacterium]|nr:hypothetical protein [Synergistaceae bacterium]